MAVIVNILKIFLNRLRFLPPRLPGVRLLTSRGLVLRRADVVLLAGLTGFALLRLGLESLNYNHPFMHVRKVVFM